MCTRAIFYATAIGAAVLWSAQTHLASAAAPVAAGAAAAGSVGAGGAASAPQTMTSPATNTPAMTGGIVAGSLSPSNVFSQGFGGIPANLGQQINTINSELNSVGLPGSSIWPGGDNTYYGSGTAFPFVSPNQLGFGPQLLMDLLVAPSPRIVRRSAPNSSHVSNAVQDEQIADAAGRLGDPDPYWVRPYVPPPTLPLHDTSGSPLGGRVGTNVFERR